MKDKKGECIKSEKDRRYKINKGEDIYGESRERV